MSTQQKISSNKNPIIPNKGVCNPHIHIFKDRAYLYATHDYSPDNLDFVMKDWEIWSSKDLLEWTKESVIHPEGSLKSGKTQWMANC